METDDQTHGQPTMQTLVLYVAHPEASRDWYSCALGLDLRREQHDGGLVHYSTQVGGLVLELYPAGDRASSQVRIELAVGDRFGDADHAPEPFPRRLEDPDGNVIVVHLER